MYNTYALIVYLQWHDYGKAIKSEAIFVVFFKVSLILFYWYPVARFEFCDNLVLGKSSSEEPIKLVGLVSSTASVWITFIPVVILLMIPLGMRS